MRNAFAEETVKLAEVYPELVLLSGDIGNRLFDPFKARFPDRFYNCGVAEANMTSLAAGLALCGMRPVTYTIAAFNTVRCLEQIRFDVCYQNLPVVIVGAGGGLSYASLNASHHALEDIAFLRILPNMTVICPGDPWEVRAAIRAALGSKGPVYLRLGKKGEPQIHKNMPDFRIGKAILVRAGRDVSLLSTGTMLPFAVEAANRLEGKGLSVQVVSFHTVKPLDEELLEKTLTAFPLVVTVEEHSRLGGFGASVLEWASDWGKGKAKLLRLGTGDRFIYEAGEEDHGRRLFGLMPDQIADTILSAWSEMKRD